MAIIIGGNLDLGKVSQLLNSIIHNDTTDNIDAVLTVKGQIGYDTTLNKLKVSDGTNPIIQLDRTDIDTDTALSSPSNTTVPSTQAIKTYIANQITSATNLRGSVTLTSASTYPTATAAAYTNGTQVGDGSGLGPTIKKGDAWYVANVASFQMGPTSTNLVKKGDLVIAIADAAGNLDAQWLILQANVDSATTTIAGIVLLATLATIQGGIGDTVVTASTLPTYLNNPESGSAESKYTKVIKIVQTLNNGANTVTHSKGTQDIANVTFINAATFADTKMGWTASSIDDITVNRTGGSQLFNIFIKYYV